MLLCAACCERLQLACCCLWCCDRPLAPLHPLLVSLLCSCFTLRTAIQFHSRLGLATIAASPRCACLPGQVPRPRPRPPSFLVERALVVVSAARPFFSAAGWVRLKDAWKAASTAGDHRLREGRRDDQRTKAPYIYLPTTSSTLGPSPPPPSLPLPTKRPSVFHTRPLVIGSSHLVPAQAIILRLRFAVVALRSQSFEPPSTNAHRFIQSFVVDPGPPASQPVTTLARRSSVSSASSLIVVSPRHLHASLKARPPRRAPTTLLFSPHPPPSSARQWQPLWHLLHGLLRPSTTVLRRRLHHPRHHVARTTRPLHHHRGAQAELATQQRSTPRTSTTASTATEVS